MAPARGPGGGDGSEQIEVHRIALAEIRDWLAARSRAGALVDPKVYAGLFLVRAEA
jgi:ADP-ribose pyrophosphatase